MKNPHLSRQVDRAKRSFESIIDDLISEIEQLESNADEMAAEITKLKEEIEELRSPD